MDLRHIEIDIYNQVNHCYPDESILQHPERYINSIVKYIELYCDDNDMNNMGAFKYLEENKESFKEKFTAHLYKSEVGTSYDSVSRDRIRKILSHIFKKLLVDFMNESRFENNNITQHSNQIVTELTEKTIMSYYRQLCL